MTRSIAQNINDVLATAATIVFGVEDAGGRCTASTAIDLAIVGTGNVAVLTVDDPECLNSPLLSDVAAGSEIIFPRFVVYSAVNTTAPISLRFSNWSAGDEVSSGDKAACGPNAASTNCEANNSGNREPWVQITGGVGHSLWNDIIVDQTCSSSIYAVCGY